MPQQLGTPWMLPAAAAVLAVTGHRRGALAAALALPVEKGVEVLTKKAVRRPRPEKAGSPALRDDAPTDGPALPSGHAAIAAATSYLLATSLRSPVLAAAGAAGTTLTGYVRVHQGAHWPSDAVAGVVLGVATAAGLTAALGVSGPCSRVLASP